jgi:hypothetical protein
VGYPSVEVERDTIAAASGTDKTIATAIARCFAALRESEAKSGKVCGPFSTRESARVGKLVQKMRAEGWDDDAALVAALDLCVCDKRPPAKALAVREVLHAAIGYKPEGGFLKGLVL